MAKKYAILVVFCFSVFFTAFIPLQNEFSWILCFYSLGFGSYALILNRLAGFSDKMLQYTFLFTSVTLVFAFPHLSDDVYRFYWDGMLVSNGLSPYTYLPTEIMAEGLITDGDVFSKLNSQEYYSVYPPLNQMLFTIAIILGGSLLSFTIWLKVLFFIIIIIGWKCTISTCKMMGLDSKVSYLFFLNPLVLVEGLGNLHIELVMVAFLAMTFFMYHKKAKTSIISLFYSGAIGFKINPLLISPFFWFNQKRGWKWRIAIATMIFSIVFMLPVFFWSGQSGFLSSIDLYFRKFEFNGSIYYLLRYLGRIYAGYNLIAQIGPFLALTVLIAIIWKSLKIKDRSTITLINLSLWAWTLYLLCSTTVHPWYIIPLIYFSIFSDKKYPIVWSYLITWTYINYSYSPYYENLWVVALEYVILLIFILIESGNYSLINRKLKYLSV